MDGTPYEYFDWRWNLPLVFLNNHQCTTLVISGWDADDKERKDHMKNEDCSIPQFGAICKKRPSKRMSAHMPMENSAIAVPTENSVMNVESGTRTGYSTTINIQECLNPPLNSPNMIVSRDTRHFDLNHTMEPLAICPCPNGNRMFWEPSDDPLPSTAYKSSKIALILYDYETEFGNNYLVDGLRDYCDRDVDPANCIDSRDFCPTLCICDIEGVCYQSSDQYNTEVVFVPYCDEGGCHVYAGVSLGMICHYCDPRIVGRCYGCIDQNTTLDRVGSNSSYIKVDKVGCHDCLELVNLKCTPNDPTTLGIPGWPSYVAITNNPNVSLVKRLPTRYSYDFKLTQSFSTIETSWLPYIMNPTIVNALFATDALTNIIYECTFFYGFNGFDQSLFTARDDTASPYVKAWSSYSKFYAKFQVNTTSFDSYKQNIIETMIETAMKTGNFSNLGGGCTEFNYNRFVQLKPMVHSKWLDSIARFDHFRIANIILVVIFGIIGIFFAMIVIVLIRRNKVLQTDFGYVCCVEASNDLILLINIVFVEGSISIWQLYNDKNVTNFLYPTDCQSWTTGYFDRIIYYIFYSTKFTTSLLMLTKTVFRFTAVYLPIWFSKTKQLWKIAVIIWIFFTITSIPLFGIPAGVEQVFTAINETSINQNCTFISCKTAFNRAQYLPLDGCSDTYLWVQVYSEYIIALLCFVFDICTAYKLMRMRKFTKFTDSDRALAHKKTIEKLFLMQNIGNLITSLVLFIPMLIYSFGCNRNRWHCIDGNIVYQIAMLLFLHNSRIALWRCLDELVTLVFQRQILKSYKKTYELTLTKVSSTITNTIHQ